MENDSRLDDALANMTDQILNNQPVSETDDDGYQRIILALQQTIQPSQLPPAEMDKRLRQAIDSEWARRPRRRASLPKPVQYAALAAVVVLMIAAVLLIGLPPDGSLPATSGSDGQLTPELVIALLVGLGVAVAAGLLIWRSRR